MNYELRMAESEKPKCGVEVEERTDNHHHSWEKPCDALAMTCANSPANPSSGGRAPTWFAPCVTEQYACYNPVDASAAKLIRSWLVYWKATGDRAPLAKARALADQMTRLQRKDGKIPTWWYDRCGRDEDFWVNCHIASANALYEMAQEEGKE